MALEAKEKIGFIYGLIQTLVDAAEQRKWKSVDSMIKSWIINSISKDFSDTFVYCLTAKDLWSTLEERFGASNAPQMYHIQRQATSLNQGGNFVTVYYNKLHRCWDEMDRVMPMPTCTCGKCSCGLKKRVSDMMASTKILQFLMGLNPTFDVARTQILNLDPLPTVNKAFSMIVTDEAQREINMAYSGTNDATSAMMAKANLGKNEGANFKRKDPSKKDKYCDHYHEKAQQDPLELPTQADIREPTDMTRDEVQDLNLDEQQDYDHQEAEINPPVQARVGTRNRRAPVWLQDYVCVAKNSEPYADRVAMVAIYNLDDIYGVDENVALGFAAVIVQCCPPSDRAALLAFKAALHEPNLGIFNSWTGADCCNKWYGVSCDQHTRRVADINLRGESEDPLFQKAHRTGYMTGYISPAICKLTRLSSITIADWKGISGEIPRCITSLRFLRIVDLIGNRIYGPIPADIGRLHRLTVLNVADNLISGEIPPSLTNLSSLMHLDLRNNRISGSLPRTFGSLTMLSRALLSGNQLIGTIPTSMCTIYRLADVDLSRNKISGPIPECVGRMGVLSTLNLDGNKLWGQIPQSLFTSGISDLNLSRNGLTGTIPDVFGARSYFTVLDLSYNSLKGAIPASISTASFIGHLDLSHNHLCGRIPSGSPFDHLEASSFVYNDCLCGKPLTPCK
ncbi:leucine-rich repeat receptor-like protein [Senna tora]|uniref:Leucine-rich repeat receptor-like protein n=1 Tax=Senna tora TaxID=362788 RepID=A0A834WI02_9FABA|nr:leucine-rich repeat receptor-like protein [Senna tora]